VFKSDRVKCEMVADHDFSRLRGTQHCDAYRDGDEEESKTRFIPRVPHANTRIHTS
jgi:hypothetical protein